MAAPAASWLSAAALQPLGCVAGAACAAVTPSGPLAKGLGRALAVHLSAAAAAAAAAGAGGLLQGWLQACLHVASLCVLEVAEPVEVLWHLWQQHALVGKDQLHQQAVAVRMALHALCCWQEGLQLLHALLLLLPTEPAQESVAAAAAAAPAADRCARLG